jgi:hypothetical protein
VSSAPHTIVIRGQQLRGTVGTASPTSKGMLHYTAVYGIGRHGCGIMETLARIPDAVYRLWPTKGKLVLLAGPGMHERAQGAKLSANREWIDVDWLCTVIVQAR